MLLSVEEAVEEATWSTSEAKQDETMGNADLIDSSQEPVFHVNIPNLIYDKEDEHLASSIRQFKTSLNETQRSLRRSSLSSLLLLKGKMFLKNLKDRISKKLQGCIGFYHKENQAERVNSEVPHSTNILKQIHKSTSAHDLTRKPSRSILLGEYLNFIIIILVVIVFLGPFSG